MKNSSPSRCGRADAKSLVTKQSGGFLLWAISLGLAFANIHHVAAQAAFPFQDPSLPTAKRVDDLVARMTLEEKAGQMGTDAPAIPRLGIPAYYWWSECLHGDAVSPATVFPEPIGLAATFDLALHSQVAVAISDEDRAWYNQTGGAGKPQPFHGLTFFAPNINIFRDPRWGRGQETYGEDPYLTAQFGVVYVKGLQGNDPKYLKVIATSKHFAVHSGPEPERHKFNAVVSDYDLHDTYLPAFQATVQKAHVQSVMGAYSSLSGVPDNASAFLLQENLRQKWGFDGYVVSDCGAIGDIFLQPSLRQKPGRSRRRRRQSRLRLGLRRRIQRPAERRQAGADYRSGNRQISQAAVYGPNAARPV